MDAPLLTPEQVAERLQITLGTTYVWLREGRLPGIRLGHRWRVQPEALESYLASQARRPGRDGHARPSEAPARSHSKPVWQVAEEIARSIPPEAWADVPADGSINLDHYLYGAPKRGEEKRSPGGACETTRGTRWAKEQTDSP